MNMLGSKVTTGYVPRNIIPAPRDCPDGSDALVASAGELGYNRELAPARLSLLQKDKVFKRAALVETFQKLRLTEEDARFVVRKHSSATPDEEEAAIAMLMKYVSDMNKKFLPLASKSSQQNFLARLICGMVGMHDFRARMWNLGLQIIKAERARNGETANQRRNRLQHLASLRLCYLAEKWAMLALIDATRQEAIANRRSAQWRKDNGDATSPAYQLYLQNLRAEVQAMKPVRQREGFPALPVCLTYAEKYDYNSVNYSSFWEEALAIPGMLASLLTPFAELIAVQPSMAIPRAASYIKWLFCTTCHVGYYKQASRLIDNERLARFQVKTGQQIVFQRPLQAKNLLKFARDHPSRTLGPENQHLRYSEIMCRKYERPHSVRTAANRPQAVNVWQPGLDEDEIYVAF